MDEHHFANWRARQVFREGTESVAVLAWVLPDGTEKPMMSHAHKPQWVWEVEIKTADGTYLRPDCAYECDHCGECLGCIRKFIFDSRYLEFDEEFAHCDKSPTGFHEVTLDE